MDLESALSGVLLDVASHSEPPAGEQVPAAVPVPTACILEGLLERIGPLLGRRAKA